MFHFLLTTTVLINSTFPRYLSQSKSHYGYTLWEENIVKERFEIVSYGQLESGREKQGEMMTPPLCSFRAKDIGIICSSVHLPFDSNETKNILRDYIFSQREREQQRGEDINKDIEEQENYDWMVHKPNMSCLIIDQPRHVIWLLGDNAGTTPLWFASKLSPTGLDIIATTDLLGAISLNYTKLKVIGAGRAIAMDMTTLQFKKMNYSPKSSKDRSQIHNVSQTSVTLLQSASSSVRSSLSPFLSMATPRFMISELDLADDWSILLECVITSQFSSMNRIRYRTNPYNNSPLKLFDTLTSGLLSQLDGQTGSVKIHQIAQERAELCHLGRSLKSMEFQQDLSFFDPIHFLFFDSPRSNYRPYTIFFQNHFCHVYNVTIGYPFHSLDHHEEHLMNLRERESSLDNFREKEERENLIDYLVNTQQCGTHFPLQINDEIVEIDSNPIGIGKYRAPELITSHSNNETIELFIQSDTNRNHFEKDSHVILSFPTVKQTIETISSSSQNLIEKQSSLSSSSHKRVNGVIVILCRNNDLLSLIHTLEQFESVFNEKYRYPYVLLNNELFSPEFKATISKIVSSSVEFGLIPSDHWEIPSWINRTLLENNRLKLMEQKILQGGSLSYRQMCRYFSGFFFRHSLLSHYDYYWRLEPHVNYTCQLNYDPFLYLQTQNKSYGFVIMLPEIRETIPTLWDHIQHFLSLNPNSLHPNSLLKSLFINPDNGRYNLCHFWSNFEIGSLKFFRSEQYLSLFSSLDSSGGFFYERWGDAPIHSLAVGIFLSQNDVHYFDDIGYSHAPYQNCPQSPSRQRDCSCDPLSSINWGNYCHALYMRLLYPSLWDYPLPAPAPALSLSPSPSPSPADET